jgi:hypothetical protein
LPGSGKSTFRKLSAELQPRFGFALEHLRLAEPLYQAQAELYRLSGSQLGDESVQDGHLLNVLGVEMRRINPDVLKDHALRRLSRLDSLDEGSVRVVICDDMRIRDAGYMRDLGFRLVGVVVSEEVSESRRRARGDLTLGSLSDPNELGWQRASCETFIDNNSDLDAFRWRILEFWEGVFGDLDRTPHR